VPQRPDGKPASTERVTFTRPAAERIARVVRDAELGGRDAGGIGWGVRLQSVPARSKTVRLCTFTGQWNAGTIKTITFKNQVGTPNTVSVTNLHLSLEPESECDVLVGREGTAWYLLQADLTKQPNFNSSQIQMFGHNTTGIAMWFSIATCGTATANE
jgi:hypothetical protein